MNRFDAQSPGPCGFVGRRLLPKGRGRPQPHRLPDKPKWTIDVLPKPDIFTCFCNGPLGVKSLVRQCSITGVLLLSAVGAWPLQDGV